MATQTPAAAPKRHIDVLLSTGLTVKIRVITLHPDDREMARAWYRADEIWKARDELRKQARAEATQAADTADDAERQKLQLRAERLAEHSADLTVKLDERFAGVFRLVLADHLSGQQIEEIIQTCNQTDRLEMFEAADNQSPWRMRLLASAMSTPSSVATVS